ncbi:MAG: DUF2934 domain-containing protein [Candidatus Omnitrophica bacterium]|nr:DUF2934 domain-containing protein [Candidatus Omnitrophota bacterium]
MSKFKESRKEPERRSSCHTSVTTEQLNKAVQKKAEELYEKSGRKPGRDMENWLEAEKIVRSQMCSDMTHMTC